MRIALGFGELDPELLELLSESLLLVELDEELLLYRVRLDFCFALFLRGRPSFFPQTRASFLLLVLWFCENIRSLWRVDIEFISCRFLRHSFDSF